MKKYTEFTGRTVEEAIEEGLAALGLTEEDADVRVLETGKKKLFGYSKARVEIAPKNDPDAFEGDYESDYIPSQSDTQTPDENAAEGKYSAENNFDIHRDAEGRTDGERAVELANIHGADPQKAELAGLIHDIEKNTPIKILLQTLEKSDILLSSVDLASPRIWHAPCGFLYARDALGIRDEDVLNAIRYHTTGRAGMSKLEKVVYLADLTSADRDFSDVKKVRKLSEQDLDGALFYSLQFILGDLTAKGLPLQPDSLACYNEIALKKAGRPSDNL